MRHTASRDAMETKEQTTILIAEDDDGHARLIELGLAGSGLRCPLIRFKDGLEAWYFLSGKSEPCLKPDILYVLLLDLRMPKLGGIEVLERLNAAAPLKNLRVIVVSTSDNPAELARCRTLGFPAFLPKPVDFNKLAQLIKW